MLMKINDDYMIESDSLNVTLKERYFSTAKDPETGEEIVSTEEKWKVVGYYATPKGALADLVPHDIMSEGMTNFKTIIDRIDTLQEDIKKLAI